MKIMFVYIVLFFGVAYNNSRNNSLKEIEDKDLIMLEHDYCSETKIMHKSIDNNLKKQGNEGS